jgi:uncharacterized membrane protein
MMALRLLFVMRSVVIWRSAGWEDVSRQMKLVSFVSLILPVYPTSYAL